MSGIPLKSYSKAKKNKTVLVPKTEIIKQLQVLCGQFKLNVGLPIKNEKL